MTNKVVSLAILAVLLIGSFSTIRAQEYEIKLFRPVKAGDKFRLLMNGRQVEGLGVFVGDRPLQQKSDETTVEATATVTALEVDGRGKPTKYRLEIEQWYVKSVGSIPFLLRPGSIVVTELQGQRYVSKINNNEVDAVSSKILSLVVPSHYTGVSDDDVFGTDQRRRIGDSWTVNSEIAARSLRESVGVVVDRRDIAGTTTLDGVVKNGSSDYLVISATLRIDKFSMPLPEGLRMQNGEMVGNFFGRFPNDAGRLPLNESGKIAAQFSGVRPADANAPELTFKGTIERSVNREFVELK